MAPVADATVTRGNYDKAMDSSISSVHSKASKASFVPIAKINSSHTHHPLLPVDFLPDEDFDKDDDDDDSSSECSEDDILVGGEGDDDEDDPHKKPWIVPRTYNIPLPNGQQRTFVLDFKQRLFVTITDTDSWYVCFKFSLCL
jgi:hypothetical protein